MKKYLKQLQDMHKKTSWDDFIIDYMSWVPMNFYRNSGLISRYPDTPRSPKIVSNDEYETLRETFLEHGRGYDAYISFFENFKLLSEIVPMPATIQQMSSENTEYSDTAIESKNTYLSNIIVAGEDVYYSFSAVVGCKNIFSSVKVRRSENVYHSFSLDDCHNVFFSKYIKDSYGIYLSTNLIGCQDCILCNDLQNQKYCIRNKQYTREEYKKEKEKLLQNTHLFESYYENLENTMYNIDSDSSSGTLLLSCEGCKNASCANFIKNSRNIMSGGLGENFYNCFDFGVDSHDFYGAVSAGTGSSHIYCSNLVEGSSHIFYSMNCHSSHHLFGCIGLKNQSYCILNKQYTKEQWEIQVEKIFLSMQEDGTFGQFFPHDMNPLYFNKSFAQCMSDYSQQEIIEKGFLYEETQNTSSNIKTVKSNSLDVYYNNGKINPSILNITLEDSDGKYYTIIKPELDFLNKYSLPIPSKHWSTRIYDHLQSIAVG